MKTDSPNEYKLLLGPGPDCLSIEQLSALLDGSVSRVVAASRRKHIGNCAYCRNEFAMLCEFDEAEVENGDEASVEWMTSELQRRLSTDLGRESCRPVSQMTSVKVGAPAWSWQRLTLVSAAALAAICALVFSFGPNNPPALAERLSAPEVWRSGNLSLVAPLDSVAEAPATLIWHPTDGANRYQVHLFEVDRTEIWKAEVDGTEVTVPAAVRRQMGPGRSYLWRVEAVGSSGRKISSSELRSFVISQPK